MTRISVVVIDGQRTFADALAARLRAEPDLVAVAPESAASARRLLGGRHVDVVLLDSELAQSLRLTADISQPPWVVMLGPVPETARIIEALRAGIAGWVPKEESIEQLLHVIRGVMRGETWLPARAVGSVLRLLLRQHGEGSASWPDPLGSLTPREREVLAYLAAGVGRREAAERMHLSAGTIRSHVQHLMRKLGVHSALEAVAIARQAQPGGTRPMPDPDHPPAMTRARAAGSRPGRHPERASGRAAGPP
jgi:DNA-binding NarL/FixJ family response regulator